VQRDVKISSPVSLNVMNHSSDAAVSDTDATKAVGTTTTTTMTESNGRVPSPRPHTIYDDDDVYGGM
jgi:hypothetical protein